MYRGGLKLQMENKLAIEVNDLHKSFKDKTAVNGISFKVKKGEVFGFLGPNGAGKTTTIRMMLGLIHPDMGDIRICGYDIKKNFYNAIKDVGAIVEIPKFYLGLTGYMNLRLVANLYPNIKNSKLEEVIELVGLKNWAQKKVKTYSLGMRQRLGIARALLNDPEVVILDEPTNGLDPKGIKEIRELICKLAEKRSITFFICSHILHEIEQMCNSVVILNSGNIVAQGSVKDILSKGKSLEEYFLNLTEGDEQIV